MTTFGEGGMALKGGCRVDGEGICENKVEVDWEVFSTPNFKIIVPENPK